MIKLVLDTNVFVSGFLWEGKEAELIRKIEKKEAGNFITPEIMSEIEKVITQDKFKGLLTKAGLTSDEILQKITSLSHIVIGPKLKENVVKVDPTDDKFIECAINSNAQYIVSRDRDLLNLNEYRNIKIITTYQTLKLLNNRDQR